MAASVDVITRDQPLPNTVAVSRLSWLHTTTVVHASTIEFLVPSSVACEITCALRHHCSGEGMTHARL